MDMTRTTPKKPRVSVDRSIERLRKQLAEFAPYLGKGKPTRSLDEFDLETERLIADLLGETSELLEAYEYAELGEAAGLVNMTDEAPEGTGMDSLRQSLLQRSRVLETCVSELESRRSDESKKRKTGRQALTGPQVAEHMSLEMRSVSHNASLRDAGQLMEQWKLGSLLVTNDQSYVGFTTDSILAREVVAKGLDPNTTLVKTCMRTPVVAIEGNRPIIDAVRMMKDQATRHLAVTQDGAIIGVISVSNILRYYSGVV
jgi:signal-transduction protein with cAMP-binding, CBS, and nucleotidyltransferase domain